MNWKLIVQLSLFGLVMAIGTVFFIPSSVEPFLWLPIFLVCAVLIAKRAPKLLFLHGLFLGLANCVWVTTAHVLLFDAYAAHHAREMEMMRTSPFPPRLMMLVVGPLIGVASGIVIGLLAWVAGLVLRRKPGAAAV